MDVREDLTNFLEELKLDGKLDSSVRSEMNILDCLRVLRNFVVTEKENAQRVVDFLSQNSKLQNLLSSCSKEEDPLHTRVFFQVLANSLVQDVELKDDIEADVTSVCVTALEESNDAKSSNVVSSILLRMMKKSENLTVFTPYVPVWLQILESPGDTSDFPLLCLKYLIENLPVSSLPDQKQDILKLVLDLEAVEDLHEESLETVVSDFTYLTDTILTTTLGSVDALKPGEIMDLLDLLTSASNTKHRTFLQEKKSLLINTVYLLRMVHDAGKNNINDFKPIGRLSELAALEKDNSTLEEHPVYQFKVKLIRLMVNLIWEHQENKTLVGEIEGLQLVLDCCNIDGKNPFITQWAVMTIKALCDNHSSNQEILLGLRRQGAADDTLLREMGISLKSKDDVKT